MTGSQRRQILRMIFSGDEPKLSSVSPRDRAALAQAGLVEVEKRGRASHLVLTDRAWEVAPEWLAAEVASPGQADLAQHLLAAVYAYTSAQEVALADFVRPALRRREQVTPEQIRAVYLEQTGGRYHQRVRLADLRAALRGSRESVDRALLVMSASGTAHLLGLDDPLDRASRDEAAAIHVGGHPRHLVYLERP